MLAPNNHSYHSISPFIDRSCNFSTLATDQIDSQKQAIW